MNISSLIQIVAILGFALGFLGVALTFTMISQGRPARGGVTLAIIGFVAGAILFLVGSGILTVDRTEAAVILNVLSGDLEDPARGPGTSIIIPGLQEATIYSTEQQSYTMSGISTEGRVQGNDAVEALTVDGQIVNVDITVIYRLSRDTLNQVHENWRSRYEDDFIRPTVRAIARDVISRFEAEAIYGIAREELQSQIEERLRTRMATEGLTLSNLLVRQITFNQDFASAIERKVVEEQELERARTEAQRVRTEASGQADAAEEAARGEANAVLIRAAADAEALRLISEQIAANPNLISYLYVQNLSDNVQTILLPSNSPFLFNLDSFTELDEGFVPPPVPEPSVDLSPSSTNDNSGD